MNSGMKTVKHRNEVSYWAVKPGRAPCRDSDQHWRKIRHWLKQVQCHKCHAISAQMTFMRENSRADSLLCFFSRKENFKSQLQDYGKSYCYGTLWDRLKRKGGKSTVTGLWLHATDHNLLTHLAAPLKIKLCLRFQTSNLLVMGTYEDWCVLYEHY